MSIQKLRKELNELLENIVQHSQHFSEEKPIPPLEISVVLSKVSKMQENLVVLRFLLEQNEKMNSSNVKKNNKIGEKSAAINNNQPNDVAFYDEVKTETLTLTQSKPKTEEVAHKLNKQRLTNLKNAFSLNDRYLFANELFNKNMEAFNDAINKLENSINIEEAKQTINAFQTALNWENDNAYFIELVDMVEQRFS